MINILKIILFFVLFIVLFGSYFTCGQTGDINKYMMYTDSLIFYNKFDSIFNLNSELYPRNEWLIEYKNNIINYDYLDLRELYIPEKNEVLLFSINHTLNRKGQKVVGFGLKEVIRKEKNVLMHYKENRLSNDEIEYYDNLVKQKVLNKLGFKYTGYDWLE